MPYGHRLPQFQHSRGKRKNLGCVTAKVMVDRQQYDLLQAEAHRRGCTIGDLIELYASKGIDSIINPQDYGQCEPAGQKGETGG